MIDQAEYRVTPEEVARMSAARRGDERRRRQSRLLKVAAIALCSGVLAGLAVADIAGRNGLSLTLPFAEHR